MTRKKPLLLQVDENDQVYVASYGWPEVTRADEYHPDPFPFKKVADFVDFVRDLNDTGILATELGDLASDAAEHPFDKIAERAKSKASSVPSWLSVSGNPRTSRNRVQTSGSPPNRCP